jgi:hypothetical protein
VSTTLNYGDIDIYAAVGREPSVLDHDYRSKDSRDLIHVPVSSFEEVFVAEFLNLLYREHLTRKIR